MYSVCVPEIRENIVCEKNSATRVQGTNKEYASKTIYFSSKIHTLLSIVGRARLESKSPTSPITAYSIMWIYYVLLIMDWVGMQYFTRPSFRGSGNGLPRRANLA